MIERRILPWQRWIGRKNSGTDGTFSDICFARLAWLIMTGHFRERETSRLSPSVAFHDPRLSSNAAIVVSVRADPKPGDDGTIENTQSAVAESDPNEINVFRLFHFLEAKARVTRISEEQPVGPPSLTLNFIWQGSKCGSEGARGARLNH